MKVVFCTLGGCRLVVVASIVLWGIIITRGSAVEFVWGVKNDACDV